MTLNLLIDLAIVVVLFYAFILGGMFFDRRIYRRLRAMLGLQPFSPGNEYRPDWIALGIYAALWVTVAVALKIFDVW